MASRRPLGTALLALLVLGSIGCASINYRKVPTPTQYDEWTDEDQRKADEMKGVRYYLPRPYLNLKQSIPVAQRVAFVSFERDERNGGYRLVLPQNPPTWLRRVAPERLSITQALAISLASPAPESADDDGPALQSGGADAADADMDGGDSADSPSSLTATTGFINATDPVTALGDKFDVVYLPDFEEQYVIQPRAGLGKADIETRLRNGWAAEVFTQQVDNSNLIPYVLRQVEQASETASGIATAWALKGSGVPVTPASMEALAENGITDPAALQSGGPQALSGIENLLGEVLLFKIAEVRIAQPGLYPILKPREIGQWLKTNGIVSGRDSEETFELYLQQAQVPWVRTDMAFIPCPPFTMIGFNTTTDVFLAPATERVRVGSVPTPGGGGSEGSGGSGDGASLQSIRTGDAATVRAALDAAKGEGPDAAMKSYDSVVEVIPTGDGNGTKVTIRASAGTLFANTNRGGYINWFADVFSGLQAGSVKARLSPRRGEVMFTVPSFTVASLANAV